MTKKKNITLLNSGDVTTQKWQLSQYLNMYAARLYYILTACKKKKFATAGYWK